MTFTIETTPGIGGSRPLAKLTASDGIQTFARGESEADAAHAALREYQTRAYMQRAGV